jgi:predicted small lipoprotein YifL
MMPHTLFAVRGPVAVCLTALLLAGGLSACGRRGPLEAPPDASVQNQSTSRPTTATGQRRTTTRSGANASDQPNTTPDRLVNQPQSVTQDTPDDETDPDLSESVLPTPTPAAPGSRKRGRAYGVPKEPFILDPLL